MKQWSSLAMWNIQVPQHQQKYEYLWG